MVTVLKDVNEKVGRAFSFDKVLDASAKPEHCAKVEAVHAVAYDKELKTEAKKELPLITPAGVFPNTRSSEAESWTGWTYHDVDDMDVDYWEALDVLDAFWDLECLAWAADICRAPADRKSVV